MIRFVRAALPELLRAAGLAKRLEHEAEFSAHEMEYRSGARTFVFDRAIYAHESVKSLLLSMQSNKCAFCESKPLHVSYGDVEHFRPKAAVFSDATNSLERPGYYWLAYEWGNLLFSCERCNRRHKRNAFPVAAGTKRVDVHDGDLTSEVPLFVNPSLEDPSEHIQFHGHIAAPKSGSIRGETTIAALGLNRAELATAREEHLYIRRLLADIAKSSIAAEELRIEAIAALRNAVRPEAEYAAMMQNYAIVAGLLPFLGG